MPALDTRADEDVDEQVCAPVYCPVDAGSEEPLSSAGKTADGGQAGLPSDEQGDAHRALPSSQSDAGVGADDADTEGDAPAVAEALDDCELSQEVPAWAAPLLGTYAMRARYYARDAIASTQLIAHEQLAWVEIRHDPTTYSVEMTQRICSNRGTGTPLGRTLDFRLLFPALYPEQRFSLSYQDGFWRTQRLPNPVGYVDEVAGCAPGMRIARQPTQSWLLDATCMCPLDDAVPTREDDCRLLDPDSDSKPGFTVELRGFASGVEYTALKDFSQLVHGTISESDGKHTALYSVLEEYERIQCVGHDCREENAVDCHPSFNPVTFAPVPDGEHGEPAWGCDEILRAVEAGTLLPAAPLASVPTGC